LSTSESIKSYTGDLSYSIQFVIEQHVMGRVILTAMKSQAMQQIPNRCQVYDTGAHSGETYRQKLQILWS